MQSGPYLWTYTKTHRVPDAYLHPCGSQGVGQGGRLSRGLSPTVCAFHQNLSKQDTRELGLSDGELTLATNTWEKGGWGKPCGNKLPMYRYSTSLNHPEKLVRGLGGVSEKLNYILSLICVFLYMFLYTNYIYAYMYVCIGMNICVSCMYTGCIYVYIHRVAHAHVYTCMLYMCDICTCVLHAC